MCAHVDEDEEDEDDEDEVDDDEVEVEDDDDDNEDDEVRRKRISWVVISGTPNVSNHYKHHTTHKLHQQTRMPHTHTHTHTTHRKRETS